jgi:hypothetical protein
MCHLQTLFIIVILSTNREKAPAVGDWPFSGGGLQFVVTLPERFHASPVDGRIYEPSRVTPEARPASSLQKTGRFSIAAGAHRFSQRSFLAEDGRSRFVVSHPFAKCMKDGEPGHLPTRHRATCPPECSIFHICEPAHGKDHYAFTLTVWNDSQCIIPTIITIGTVWETSDGFG